MSVPFEVQIALRYLLAKRKQAFISVISTISTLGVTIGVMAVVIALAMMTGLQRELRERILGANAHIYVSRSPGFVDPSADIARLRRLPHVVGAAPIVIGRALISASRGSEFISVQGIDPALEPTVTDVGKAIQEGSLAGLAQDAASTRPNGILLGRDLAATLGVRVGDLATLLTPQGTLSPMGIIPHHQGVRVAGTFSLGLYEFDSTFGFVSLDFAKRLFDRDAPDFIQLRLDDIYAAPAVADLVRRELGAAYFAQDWGQMNKSLFSALTLEKLAVSLAIGLIVVVAALNIVSSLILLVMEKNRDIAILKTMGASARSVTLIFMTQGVIIGLVGTTVGGGAGLLLARVLDRYQVIHIPFDVYTVSYLPFKVLPFDFAMVVVTALLVCFVATIYPSRQAARLDPAQALRYE